MSKYVVVVFTDEQNAYKGVEAFKALQRRDMLTFYSHAVINKDSDGKVSVKEEQGEGPLGTTIGMLTGGLVGLLAGPAGAAVGMAGGTLLGMLFDLNNVGVGLDFVELVAQKMDSGTIAVVTEIEEYWTTPLDTEMELLGGTVVRKNRYVFEDEQWEQEVLAWKQEVAELKEEIKETSDENKARLKAKSEELRQKLHDAHDNNKAKIKQLDDEMSAKVAKLENQAAKAQGEAKAKIEKRMEEVKSGYKARNAKLKEAGHLIKEALSV